MPTSWDSRCLASFGFSLRVGSGLVPGPLWPTVLYSARWLSVALNGVAKQVG